MTIPYLIEWIGEVGELQVTLGETCYWHYPSGMGSASVMAIHDLEQAEMLVNSGEFRWFSPHP